MTRKITPPMSQIPIGTVAMGDRVLEVKQHPEFTRFFFDLFARVGGVQSWNVEDLMLAPTPDQTDTALIQQPADLANQIAQLREQLATQGDIETQLAQLREQVAYMGSIRRKRVLQDKVTIGVGVNSVNYTISPAVASVDLCDLVITGTNCSAAASASTDFSASLELISTTTITATRTGSTGSVTVYFRLTEFTQ